MSATTTTSYRSAFLEPRRARDRVLVLLALLVVPQLVLIGPSLVGAKVLLPLDLLQQPGIYLPLSPGSPPVRPTDHVLSDLVYELEPQRMYCVEAVRSGRMPLWNPLIYCGTPFLAANHTSVFYPLRVIDYLVPGPIAVAWVQLAKCALAGVGMYLFLRRALALSFWPAAIGAALWPNVGFLVLWAGFTISQVGAHLPWVLLATDESLRRPRSPWPIALAVATAVALVSGHASIAGHVLLASGLYALFRAFDLHGARGFLTRACTGGLAAVVFGWIAGFCLSGPQTMPTLDYMQESRRIEERQEGRVETPSVGIAGLPAIVMPYFDGSTQRHTVLTVHGNRPESSPAAYAGLLSLLVLAPLGFAHRRLLRFQLFWLALGFLGASSILGVPLLERVFELPLLNTLRNNRFTLVTAFAIVAMSATGLEHLVRGEFAWRRPYWIAVGSLVVVLGACVARIGSPPAMLREVRSAALGGARPYPPLDSLESIDSVTRWFERVALGYALLAAGALVLWWSLARLGGRFGRTPRAALVLGLLSLAEVVSQAFGTSVQTDRSLYYPRTPLVEKLATLPPGRLCGGFSTLPASLGLAVGLADVRGYDAVDPARIVELYESFEHERAPPPSDYARLQWWFPKVPHGLADLIGLRYVVLFGEEQPGALFRDGGFSIHERPECPPRAFFAARAEVVNDAAERLAKLADPDFDPRAVVYLEADAAIPSDAAPAAGSAHFELDEPERIVLALDVRSAGWLVLADRWTDGWKAWVDGVERPVLCADHAFRAVHVEPGAQRLEFRYEPKSWRQGWMAAAIGLFLLAGWFAYAVREPRSTGPSRRGA